MNTHLKLMIALVISTTFSSVAYAQGDPNSEPKFIAMLKDATLKGSWAPIQGGPLGKDKDDNAYRIKRAEKTEDGKWSIVSLFQMRGREFEFPIRSDVKFAGDTAVLILNDVSAGRGAANWSARVMFHGDIYTGRWWETANPEHGGTIAGTITREGEAEQSSPPAKAPDAETVSKE